MARAHVRMQAFAQALLAVTSMLLLLLLPSLIISGTAGATASGGVRVMAPARRQLLQQQSPSVTDQQQSQSSPEQQSPAPSPNPQSPPSITELGAPPSITQLPTPVSPDWGLPAFMNGALRAPTGVLETALSRIRPQHTYPGPNPGSGDVIDHVIEIQSFVTWMTLTNCEHVLTVTTFWDLAQNVINNSDNLCYMPSDLNARKERLTSAALGHSSPVKAVDAYGGDANVLAYVRSRREFLARLLTSALATVANRSPAAEKKCLTDVANTYVKAWLQGL